MFKNQFYSMFCLLSVLLFCVQFQKMKENKMVLPTQLQKSCNILCTSSRENGLYRSGIKVLSIKEFNRLFSNNNRDIASPNFTI